MLSFTISCFFYGFGKWKKKKQIKKKQIKYLFYLKKIETYTCMRLFSKQSNKQ